MAKQAKDRIAVLGAGAWGTALAVMLKRAGNEIALWGRDSDVLEEIALKKTNTKYLFDIKLAELDLVTHALEQAVEDCSALLLVTPAQTIRYMAESLKDLIEPSVPVILCAKGIDRKTGKLPAENFSAIAPQTSLAALSGPSFAADVARGLPTAVSLAAEDEHLAQVLATKLSGPAFRVYANNDLKGVELGGALKNVIALAIGACRGMKLGASAEAALTARGFAELSRLAVALGAQKETLMGLSGLGDLLLTCSSEQSRNFSYGMKLGRGDKTDNLPLAEGALTAAIALQLAKEHNIACPVIETVSALVERKINPQEALKALLSRPLKRE